MNETVRTAKGWDQKIILLLLFKTIAFSEGFRIHQIKERIEISKGRDFGIL
ncbi:MAG: hypothetical protein WC139_10240 [Candidatus Kapaibacterium sp.]